MYICLCNGLKDKQVAEAKASGCASVSDVFMSLGCRPCCGKCVPYMREQVSFSDMTESLDQPYA